MEKEYTWRLFLLLIGAFFCLLFAYILPTKIELKKVDILSDLRNPSSNSIIDNSEEEKIDEDLENHKIKTTASKQNHRRDKIYRKLIEKEANLEILKEHRKTCSSLSRTSFFKDYSSNHNGLERVFKKLLNKEPVRIAFVGDSFIGDDIFTIDVRSLLQKHYGGSGVGWMPFINLESRDYRKGVKHRFIGWNKLALLKNRKEEYTLSGSIFKANDEDLHSISYEWENNEEIENSTIFYKSSKNIELLMKSNGSSYNYKLPKSKSLTSFLIKEKTNKIALEFKNIEDASFYGISFESVPKNGGVFVDNYSIKGHSGIHLLRVDKNITKAYSSCRPYDLIIFEYGVNAISSKQKRYSGYRKSLMRNIKYIQSLYPKTDIMIMGIGSRGIKKGTDIKLMPQVLTIRKEQLRIAKELGVVFWDTLDVLGMGEYLNSWIKKKWLAKDCIHLSFRGGKELAKRFYESFIFEELYYSSVL